MERVVVREFLYPSFLTPPPSLTFLDQYAFRPTGSTSAAVISLLHTITTLLQSNPFVIVISLDFSKAFDCAALHFTRKNGRTGTSCPLLQLDS